MKKLILGLSAAALLCGCASEKKYNRELDSFPVSYTHLTLPTIYSV